MGSTRENKGTRRNGKAGGRRHNKRRKPAVSIWEPEAKIWTMGANTLPYFYICQTHVNSTLRFGLTSEKSETKWIGAVEYGSFVIWKVCKQLSIDMVPWKRCLLIFEGPHFPMLAA
jgi:hypothetical protein